MRIARLLVGLAGLALCAASWVSEPGELTAGLFAMIAVCALGGLVPLRMPGLSPLPVSLPLVGAIAVTSGAAEACTAGFVSGLATLFAARDDPEAPGPLESFTPRLLSGFATAGALSLAAGMVASGFSRFNLLLVVNSTPLAPAPDDAMKSLVVISVAFFLALQAAHRSTTRGGRTLRDLVLSAAGSTTAAGVSLLIAGAMARWGAGPVLACLTASGVTAIACSGLIRRHRRLAAAARRGAETGIALVEALALAIEAKDKTSERHLLRMRIYAQGIARRLGMSAEESESLEYAAILHDIGKLVVPESILSKPAGLSAEEFRMMSSHAKVGAEILQTTSLSSGVVAMVRHHHERYDGTGYPDGLIGMEIPLGARILAAVDTYEAFTSERPYRKGLPGADALDYLERNAGSLFDPRVVRVLVEHHAEFETRVEQEEKARAERLRPSTGLVLTDADTIRMNAPFQAVLDRIASSHMEVYSLHEISQALGKTLDIEESFALIMGKIQRLLHYSSCAIYVMDPDGETLRPRYACGPGASRILQLTIPLGQRISGWVAMRQRSCSSAAPPAGDDATKWDGSRSDLSDLTDDPETAPLTSSLAAPMLLGESLIGVIALYDDAAHTYSPHEEQLLSMIAIQVAGAVRASLLFEQTQEMALTDSLTGLPNSRYMFIAFDQEATRAREQGEPLTLMVMNIDNFREINDGFGHHAGDRFLVGMAKAIRAQMRTCDSCIRYAGDEFVAILPRLAGGEIEAVVERLADAARDYCMEARPGRPVQLTLSVGYATMPEDGEDFESLMAAAAKRMQQQKALHRRLLDARSRFLPGSVTTRRK